MNGHNLQTLSILIKKNNIEVIDLKSIDLTGRLHHVSLPVRENILKDIVTDGVAFLSNRCLPRAVVDPVGGDDRRSRGSGAGHRIPGEGRRDPRGRRLDRALVRPVGPQHLDLAEHDDCDPATIRRQGGT